LEGRCETGRKKGRGEEGKGKKRGSRAGRQTTSLSLAVMSTYSKREEGEGREIGKGRGRERKIKKRSGRKGVNTVKANYLNSSANNIIDTQQSGRKRKRGEQKKREGREEGERRTLKV